MTATFIQLSEAEFAEQYPLRQNHYRDGFLFETFGEELAFVMKQDPRTIWTLVDGDDGPCIISGIHYVNRIGYFVSSIPAPRAATICVPLNEEAYDA